MRLKLAAFCTIIACVSISCEKPGPPENERKALVRGQCGDLLSRFATKPAELKFVSCDGGGPQTVLRAHYRVKGEHAATVEAFLRRKYGMGRLVFVCCGWELRGGPYGDLPKDGYPKDWGKLTPNAIIINMHSEETLLRRREDWHRIPYFLVEVRFMII